MRMEQSINQFAVSFGVKSPPDCIDTELYIAIICLRFCREDAWDNGSKFGLLGKRIRRWFGDDTIAARLMAGTSESCSDMRSKCGGTYICRQLPGYIDLAQKLANDPDWGVRTTVCEALHDLGLNSRTAWECQATLIDLAVNDPMFIVHCAITSSSGTPVL